MFPDFTVKSKEWYTFFNKRVTFTEITELATTAEQKLSVLNRQADNKSSRLLRKMKIADVVASMMNSLKLKVKFGTRILFGFWMVIPLLDTASKKQESG